MKIQKATNKGFTMVELMIVVGIIAVIAGIAVPAWMRARESAQRTGLINELRTTSEAFLLYASEQNQLPPTAGFQQIPAGMNSYMPKNSKWTTQPDAGGYMCWLNTTSPLNGYNAYIGVYGTGLSLSSLQQMDDTIDDGNLSTGEMTYLSSGDGDNSASTSWLFYGVQSAQ